MKLMTPSNDTGAIGAGVVQARNHAALRIGTPRSVVTRQLLAGPSAQKGAFTRGGPKQQRPSGSGASPRGAVVRGDRSLKRLGVDADQPGVAVVRHSDQISPDAQVVVFLPDAAFADRQEVATTLLELAVRRPSYNAQPVNVCQRGDQFLPDSATEILLIAVRSRIGQLADNGAARGVGVVLAEQRAEPACLYPNHGVGSRFEGISLVEGFDRDDEFPQAVTPALQGLLDDEMEEPPQALLLHENYDCRELFADRPFVDGFRRTSTP